MKESKIIVIVSSIILFILFPVLVYYYHISKLVYDILISITTGLIVSIITALCQYFINRKKIKDKVFSCYFDFYKAIYVSEQHKILFHYNVIDIYKKFLTLSTELSKYISEYSGFINNKKNKLYKKLNPNIAIDYNKFNIKNFIKLIMPFNIKPFNNLILPIKELMEQILRKINSKKFDKDLKEFIETFNKFNGV